MIEGIPPYPHANDNQNSDELITKRRDSLIQSGALVNTVREWIEQKRQDTDALAKVGIYEHSAVLEKLEIAMKDTDAAIESAEQDRSNVELHQHAQEYAAILGSEFHDAQNALGNSA